MATKALVSFSPRLSPNSASGKCAQLLVSIKGPEDQDVEGFQKVLHFGSVAVGCTAERQIKLYNPSVVHPVRGGGEWGQDSGPQGWVLLTPTPVQNVPLSLHTFGSKPHITHVY